MKKTKKVILRIGMTIIVCLSIVAISLSIVYLRSSYKEISFQKKTMSSDYVLCGKETAEIEKTLSELEKLNDLSALENRSISVYGAFTTIDDEDYLICMGNNEVSEEKYILMSLEQSKKQQLAVGDVVWIYGKLETGEADSIKNVRIMPQDIKYFYNFNE